MSMDSQDPKFGRTRPSKTKRFPFVIVGIVAVIVAAIAWWLAHSTPQQPAGGGRFGGARGGGQGGPGGGLPMPVGVAKAETGDINIVLNALGTVTMPTITNGNRFVFEGRVRPNFGSWESMLMALLF